MKTPPADLTPADVLACARSSWEPSLVAVEHLPVGFGAHHWRADGPDGPLLFLSLDSPTPRHTAVSLEGAYSSAAELAAAGLEFVHVSEGSRAGSFTVPLGGGRLSATRWAPGVRPSQERAHAEGLVMVERLHRADVPSAIPRWEPLVAMDMDARLASWVREPWTSGPLGEEARAAVRDHLTDIVEWLSTYRRCVAALEPGTFVATHGEPGVHNLWLTDDRLVLLDWESLALAPPERDLRSFDPIPEHADPVMVDLVDLEWRLDEVDAYAQLLWAPHKGDEDDAIRLEGLREELSRPAARCARSR